MATRLFSLSRPFLTNKQSLISFLSRSYTVTSPPLSSQFSALRFRPLTAVVHLLHSRSNRLFCLMVILLLLVGVFGQMTRPSCIPPWEEPKQEVIDCTKCGSSGHAISGDGLSWVFMNAKEPKQEVKDCTKCGSSGHAISGDLSILENMIIETDARYIIVIEKHAIFQRLVQDRIFNQIPSILITAKGFPDIPTRFLLHRLSIAFPSLPILALVDWNPAGLAILCTYKYGSIGMGLEAYRYACNVKWIGDDLQLLQEESLVPLKTRDLQITDILQVARVRTHVLLMSTFSPSPSARLSSPSPSPSPSPSSLAFSYILCWVLVIAGLGIIGKILEYVYGEDWLLVLVTCSF